MMTSLWDLPTKKTAFIQQFAPDLDQQILARLREIGIEVGQDITLIKRAPIGGPLVLQVSDSVFSLGPELAKLISVEVS